MLFMVFAFWGNWWNRALSLNFTKVLINRSLQEASFTTIQVLNSSVLPYSNLKCVIIIKLKIYEPTSLQKLKNFQNHLQVGSTPLAVAQEASAAHTTILKNIIINKHIKMGQSDNNKLMLRLHLRSIWMKICLRWLYWCHLWIEYNRLVPRKGRSNLQKPCDHQQQSTGTLTRIHFGLKKRRINLQ